MYPIPHYVISNNRLSPSPQHTLTAAAASAIPASPHLPLLPKAFAEVLANNESWSAPMEETYELLGVDPASITSLDTYLQVGGWW